VVLVAGQGGGRGQTCGLGDQVVVDAGGHQFHDPRRPQPPGRHRGQRGGRTVEEEPRADEVLGVGDRTAGPEQVAAARRLREFVQDRVPGGAGHQRDEPARSGVQQRAAGAGPGKIMAAAACHLACRSTGRSTGPRSGAAASPAVAELGQRTRTLTPTRATSPSAGKPSGGGWEATVEPEGPVGAPGGRGPSVTVGPAAVSSCVRSRSFGLGNLCWPSGLHGGPDDDLADVDADGLLDRVTDRGRDGGGRDGDLVALLGDRCRCRGTRPLGYALGVGEPR